MIEDDRRRQLAHARHVPDVVALVIDYLATWTPPEIAALPDSCRPWRLGDLDDLSRYALLLAFERLEPGSGPEVERMADFICAAYQRAACLSALSAQAEEPAGLIEPRVKSPPGQSERPLTARNGGPGASR